LVLKHATVVSASQALARSLTVPSRVVPNGYNSAAFRTDGEVSRIPERIAFVGRLIDDKGIRVLLPALAEATSSGYRPTLAIIGDGEGQSTLREDAARYGLETQIEFLGRLTPEETGQELLRATILVIPSVGWEGFGIVALEGLAAGCHVIASDIGGLPEAVGNVGTLVRPGDANALARTLVQVLSGRVPPPDSNDVVTHLSLFSEALMVRGYLDALETSTAGIRREVR